MRYYPLFISLEKICCLVVGAGSVGMRKIESLLRANPCSVLVLDIKDCPPELEELMREYPQLRYVQRNFEPEDLTGMGLVFAASGLRALNAEISTLCADRGIWCNCIDAPDEGSFIVPAVAQADSICVALSTGGNSPALSRKIRIELESMIKTRYAPLARLLGAVRPLVLALNLDTGQNTTIFRRMLELPLAEALQKAVEDGSLRAATHNDIMEKRASEKGARQCVDLLTQCLPPNLHQHIAELLHGLA